MSFAIRNTNITLDNTSAINIPGTPVAGETVIYPKADKLLYYKNDAGVEQRVVTPLTPISGSIVQVLSSTKQDAQSTTSTTYVDITGLSLTITPKFLTSQILVMVCLNNIANSTSNITFFNILRGSTTLTKNTSGGLTDTNNAFATGGGVVSNPDRDRFAGVINIIDTPASIAALTYKCQFRVTADTGWINRWALNTDAASVSTITLMEVAV